MRDSEAKAYVRTLVLAALLGVPVAFALQHHIDPAPLAMCDVLEQTADAQRTGRRCRPCLIVRQPVRGGAQHFPLLREKGEQSFAFVADGRRRPRHVDPFVYGSGAGFV